MMREIAKRLARLATEYATRVVESWLPRDQPRMKQSLGAAQTIPLTTKVTLKNGRARLVENNDNENLLKHINDELADDGGRESDTS